MSGRTGHKWDGDLEEWNNPAPRWWLYFYFGTIIWAVGYLIAYPGLGNWDGLLGWSQLGQYEEEMQAAADRYEPIYERYAAMGFAELKDEPDAMKLGASLAQTHVARPATRISPITTGFGAIRKPQSQPRFDRDAPAQCPYWHRR